MHIQLAYPPTANTYWRHDSGKHYICQAGITYRTDVMASILAAYGEVPRLEGAIRMAVDVYPPDRKRRDIDNLLKPLLDALEHCGVYKDDYQVTEIHIRRLEPEEPGGLLVWLESSNISWKETSDGTPIEVRDL